MVIGPHAQIERKLRWHLWGFEASLTASTLVSLFSISGCTTAIGEMSYCIIEKLLSGHLL